MNIVDFMLERGINIDNIESINLQAVEMRFLGNRLYFNFQYKARVCASTCFDVHITSLGQF